MRTTNLLVAGALILCGCSAQAARQAPPPSASVGAPAASQVQLEGNWRFVQVEGARVPAGVTATLRLREGQASGKAGCNAYGASWTSSPDGAVSFGSPRSTKMACLTPRGAMEVERRVFDALAHVARARRTGARLQLLDAAGKPVARLERDAD